MLFGCCSAKSPVVVCSILPSFLWNIHIANSELWKINPLDIRIQMRNRKTIQIVLKVAFLLISLTEDRISTNS